MLSLDVGNQNVALVHGVQRLRTLAYLLLLDSLSQLCSLDPFSCLEHHGSNGRIDVVTLRSFSCQVFKFFRQRTWAGIKVSIAQLLRCISSGLRHPVIRSICPIANMELVQEGI